MKICFIDSGIGGLSVYVKYAENQFKQKQSVEQIIYFQDTQNSPYGSKTKNEIIAIMKNNIEHLIKKYDCDIFVIACNTATACAIKTLRESFKEKTFVGIEPNIKNACLNDGNTLVMTTTATYFYSQYVQTYKNNEKIYFLPQNNLAKYIEKYYDNEKYLTKIMQEKLQYFKDKNIKNIVLGCTHYLYLKQAIKSVLGNVTFFDSIDGVVNRLINIINNEKH